ncbi:MAG: DNA helicase UvrD, partial [Elusimicrobia bacterium]|nr:DNA helicase UvrD [Elusimicrobiota bacterium]
QECFGSQTRYIYAIETGLSSDPPMNWRLSALDRALLLSNSDAHSLKNLGREANCFDCALDYRTITEVIKTKDASRFLGTIEFFPEEGKYHYDGHRNCQARIHPREAIANHNLCPSCNQKVTIGVLHRVEELADRPLGYRPECAMSFSHMILLEEIIAAALGQGRETVGVQKEYLALTGRLGSELDILLRIPEAELRHQAPGRVVEGILKARLGEVDVLPGYDGLYGEIKLRWGEVVVPQRQAQLDLFA